MRIKRRLVKEPIIVLFVNHLFRDLDLQVLSVKLVLEFLHVQDRGHWRLLR
jgi:hypothetical protein